MEIASWLGPYAGGTEYDEGRPYISAIDGPGGPIITGDHLTRDRPSWQERIQGGPVGIYDRLCDF